MSCALRDAKLDPTRDRLHQRPRHQHAARRQGRDGRREAGLRRSAYKLNICSTKSQLGHLLASGGVELILSCWHSYDQIWGPPTINLDGARSGVRSELHAARRRNSVKIGAVTEQQLRAFGHNASVIAKRVAVICSGFEGDGLPGTALRPFDLTWYECARL